MPTDDRAILEKAIFRELYVARRYRQILFVGCSEFTSWYPELFENTPVAFDTVDSDPEKAPFGSPRRHFVRSFESLSDMAVLRETYDLVVLNGVFGYGIDTSTSKKTALDTAGALLEIGGAMVIGYGDRPDDGDLDPGLIDPAVFAPTTIPGLTTTKHRSTHINGHTFVCYTKHAGVFDASIGSSAGELVNA